MLLAALALAEPVEVRVLAGALVETQSHGEVDLGVRAGPWSAQLLTDTLDLRASPEGERGRAWAGLRAEGFAAGLMLSPWTGWVPDPARALTASYVGPEAGAVRYLPAGLYAGGAARAQLWAFGALSTTTVPVPPAAVVVGGEALAGLWRPGVAGWARAGVDRVMPLGGEAGWEPRVDGELLLRPRLGIAPRLELRGGWSPGRSDFLAWRVGGSMPYSAPVTGLGWAELWTSAFAAARVGVRVGSPDAAPGSGAGAEPVTVPDDRRVRARGGLLVDAAWVDAPVGGCDPACLECSCAAGPVEAVGFGADLGLRQRRAWLAAEVGTAPVTWDVEERWPLTVLLRVGRDWAPLCREPTGSR